MDLGSYHTSTPLSPRDDLRIIHLIDPGIAYYAGIEDLSYTSAPKDRVVHSSSEIGPESS